MIHVQDAIREMTAVAEHINAMKKKYDAAVHVQELQSLIRGNEVCVASELCACVGGAGGVSLNAQ